MRFLLAASLAGCPASVLALRGFGPTPEPVLDFIHIPKSAGTAVEDLGLAGGVRWGREKGLNCSAFGCNLFHVPPCWFEDWCGQAVYDYTKTFCIVRNPYTRLVSEYQWQVKMRPDLKLKCTPEAFNEHMMGVTAAYYMFHDNWISDCHFLPQTSYVWGKVRGTAEAPQTCRHILKFEELPGAFDQLMAENALSMRLETKVNRGLCPNLQVSDINFTMRDFLQVVYKLDFILLGYSAEFPKQAQLHKDRKDGHAEFDIVFPSGERVGL